MFYIDIIYMDLNFYPYFSVYLIFENETKFIDLYFVRITTFATFHITRWHYYLLPIHLLLFISIYLLPLIIYLFVLISNFMMYS